MKPKGKITRRTAISLSSIAAVYEGTAIFGFGQYQKPDLELDLMQMSGFNIRYGAEKLHISPEEIWNALKEGK